MARRLPRPFFALLALLLSSAFARGQAHKAFQLSRQAYDIARANPDSSLKLGSEALRLAQQAGSPQELARAHSVLGRTSIFKSDLGGLSEHVAAGLPQALRSGNDTLISELYNLSSLNHRFKHEADSALTALGKAEEYARKGKMTTQLTNTLLAKGALLSDKRQYARALEAYQEALLIDAKKGDEIGQALDLQNIGLTLLLLKRDEGALQAFRQALPLNRKQNDKHGLIRTLNSMANAYWSLGKLDSADAVLDEAFVVAGEMEDALAQGAIANNKSTYAENRGDLNQTRVWAQRAIDLYYSTGDSVRAASSLGNLGEVLRKTGHLPEAERTLTQAIGYARRLGETKILAQNLKMLGLVYEAQGRGGAAAPLFLEYATLQDTLYKQNLAAEVANLQARQEAFVKDQQIALLNRNVQVKELTLAQKELEIQRKTLIGGIVLLLVLSVAGGIYFSAKRRRLALEAGHQRQLREEQARRFAAAHGAEEAERKRIARELHDGLGQMLASVRLHMAARSGPEREFADLEKMLAESSDEVRFISHNLMPQALEKKGLDPAVEEFCDRIARTKKINVIQHLEPVGQYLSPESSTMVYRVLQELVSNTLKHAAATELYITLADEDREISLTVEDNGVGFDPGNLEGKEGIGMGNLRERVASVGGSLEIESSVGNGALFVVRVPKSTVAETTNEEEVAGV